MIKPRKVYDVLLLHTIYAIFVCCLANKITNIFIYTYQRRHPACRCNVATSSAVDIFDRPPWWFRQRDELRPKTKLLPSRDRVHGKVFINSSLTAYLLARLKIPEDLFIGSRALSFSDPYIHFACLSVRHSVCPQLRS